MAGPDGVDERSPYVERAGAAHLGVDKGEQEASAGLIGSLAHLARRTVVRVGGARLASDVGWVIASFGANQAVRLGTNLVLARLLAPQIFGIMLIVNTLRTGIELLSDIGVSQNIIANPAGDEPTFYNTAWTLQLIRGVALCVLVLLFSASIADLYGEPVLRVVIPLMAVLFLLTGFQSPALSLLVKKGRVRTIAAFELSISVANLIINVGLALWSPTVWALVIGLLISTTIQSLASFLLMENRRVRLQLDHAVVGEILMFGKWVFASSIVLFLAMNFDRLYFAKVIPLTLLGIYGVARTYSDTAALLVQRVSNILVFPKIAASGQFGSPLRHLIASTRAYALIAIAVGLSLAVAVSDQLILALYDPRYHAAAFMLPILLIGVWFSVLATLGEAIMLGIGRPAHAARANAVKLIWICIALPLILPRHGMVGALGILVLADIVRYFSLSISQYSQRVSFVRQDIALTSLLVVLTIIWRLSLSAAGVVVSLPEWWNLGADLHVQLG